MSDGTALTPQPADHDLHHRLKQHVDLYAGFVCAARCAPVAPDAETFSATFAIAGMPIASQLLGNIRMYFGGVAKVIASTQAHAPDADVTSLLWSFLRALRPDAAEGNLRALLSRAAERTTTEPTP